MPSLKDFAARFQTDPVRDWVPLLGEATEAKGVIYARNTCPHCSSWNPEVIRKFHGPWMTRYAALGLGARVVGWQGGECRPCRSYNNKVFDPASAPPLPLREWRNTYCNCHYEPVISSGR